MKALALTFVPGVSHRQPAGRRPHPSLLKRIATWRRVAVERRRLLNLDPRILADMGLTPEQAAWEASRPFWDVDTYR